MAKANLSKALVATAYHEAGHAVIAWVHRVGLREVSIIPDADAGTLGHCGRYRWPSFAPDAGLDARTERRAMNLMMVHLAGREAERRFTGRYNHIGAAADLETAYTLAAYVTGDTDPETAAFLHWLTLRTRRALGIHWIAVEALATTLLNAQRLDGKQVREVILGAFDQAGNASRAERHARQQ